jgi:hypothetical protein
MRRGSVDSSPSEPADSNPANDRKPKVEASARVESDVPGGRLKTSSVTPCPSGAPPKTSLPTMIAIRTRINATEATSKSSSVRDAVRIERDAMSHTSAHPTSASGSHAGCSAIPVLRRNACPKIAIAAIETTGKIRYVPSSAHPATKPAREPSAPPTNA